MGKILFSSVDGTPVRLGVSRSREGGESADRASLGIYVGSPETNHWTVVLDGEAISRFLALLDTPGEATEAFARPGQIWCQALWLRESAEDGPQLCLNYGQDRCEYDAATDEWEEWEEELTLRFVEEVAGDMAEYIRWAVRLTRDEPRFWLRNRVAFEISDPRAKRDDVMPRLDEASLTDAVRIVGNLAHRGRLDLAVDLLERQHRRGRIDLESARAVPIYYDFEAPKDVSWEELFHWSGLTIPRPAALASREPDATPDLGYSAYDYCACFEDAFDSRFEDIDFETMDFRDVQARLRLLGENLERHFADVNYPPAERGEVVPNIALQQREAATRSPTGGFLSINYTPTLSYDEARRHLLFAHRVCFEDPLSQLVEPIASLINQRAYHFQLPATTGIEAVVPRVLRVEPAEIDEGHFALLRETLKSTQRLARLIREKIVIPHQLIDVEITASDWQAREFPRFPNRTVRHATEEAAIVLGGLLAEGRLRGLGFPNEIEQAAATFGGQEELGSSDWLNEFFWGSTLLCESYPPFERWLDHVYRLLMYDRYHEIKELGYTQHFTDPDGYKLLAVLEAAGLAQGAVRDADADGFDRRSYAKRVRADGIRLHRLESQLRPDLTRLSDEDLISIRLEEELFDDWRCLIRDSLQAVESYEAATGGGDADVVRDEIRDRMGEWSDKRSRRLRSEFLGGVFDVTAGAVVGVVTSLPLDSPQSLAIGVAYSTLKTAARLFAWRRQDRLSRHFLSII